MKVTYNNKNIERLCNDANFATKKYGVNIAEKLQLRTDQIKAADTVEQMINLRIGRCHKLKGNRKEQYAMDLVYPLRLVFEKLGEEIQLANILEVVDYH